MPNIQYEESLAGAVYILYLDESGNHKGASHFVLAGLAVFEREIHWYTQDLDMLQKQHFPNENEPIHFHATTLRTSPDQGVDPPWDKLTPEQRRQLRSRVYSIIRDRQGVLFGCAIETQFANSQGEDPYERAFEEMVSRFDLFMGRMNRQAEAASKEAQRGLLVLAELNRDNTRNIARLARRFHDNGTRWGLLHNVTDIPYFASAKETRMLQYADFCANAIYRRHHSKQIEDFDIVAPKFDHDGTGLNGLVHLTTDQSCACIACFSRLGRQQALLPQ